MKNAKIKGFTLVEIMVSVSVFAVVMLIASSSIFGVFDANRKSQSLRGVMDNLNFSLESMTRTIRFGTRYHCNATALPLSSTADCAGGSSSIAVLDSTGAQVVFRLNNNRIERSVNGGTSYQPVTSSDVFISSLSFRVLGSASYSSGNLFQPQVIIIVKGYSGSKSTSRTDFSLQTTVSQRVFDSQ